MRSLRKRGHQGSLSLDVQEGPASKIRPNPQPTSSELPPQRPLCPLGSPTKAVSLPRSRAHDHRWVRKTTLPWPAPGLRGRQSPMSRCAIHHRAGPRLSAFGGRRPERSR